MIHMKGISEQTLYIVIAMLIALAFMIVLLGYLTSPKSGLPAYKSFGCYMCDGLISNWMNNIFLVGKLLNPCIHLMGCCDEATGQNCPAGYLEELERTRQYGRDWQQQQEQYQQESYYQ